MSKKMLKRSLALGALMAFVITGQAWAESTYTINNGTGQKFMLEDNKLVDSWAQNEETIENLDSITVEGGGWLNFNIGNKFSEVKINYDKTINLSGGNSRIEIHNDCDVQLKEIEVGSSSEGLIQFNSQAYDTLGSLEVAKIIVNDNAKLVFSTWGDKNKDKIGENSDWATSTSSVLKLNELVVGPEGVVKTGMYCDENDWGYYNNITIEGDITMTLGADAMVDFGTDKVLINANSLKVNVLDTDNLPKVYLSTASLDNQDTKALENKDISVVAAGDNNTGNATADLGKLAGVVVRNAEAEEEEPITGATLIQEASSIYDAASGTVAVDADGKATVTEIATTKNPNVYGITENNALSLMAWRAEMNDMNKRMGELRNANGEHGVWVRMVRGEAEYESITNEYNQYQLGYDEKLSTDPSWTVGLALSYTDGESSYSSGSAENEHKGLSVYASKLNDDGSFIDLIAKYSRMENDFETTLGNGDYSTNGYSFSAEYGKRLQQGNGLWIEPQVELTYGKVGSADYKMGTIDVAQDSIDSLVGRLGFSLGKDIKQGNVYARASYLYDFDGETSVSFNDNGKPRTMEQDLGGGWWEVGVGANINLSKATYIYADVEKTFGGEVDTNWQWNLGVRYSF